MKIMLIIILLFITPAWASQPDEATQQARYTLMDREMNCIKHHGNSKVDWNDVCYMSDQDNSRFVDSLKKPSYITSNVTPQIRFDVGTEVGHINYREKSVGTSEKGMVYGLYGILNMRTQEDYLINVFHTDVHVDYSRAIYKGGDNSDISGSIHGINNFMVEPRFWMGKDFLIGDKARITPFAGIGYRYFLDKLQNKISSEGDPGYNRRSQYLYAPFGTEIAFAPTEGWEIGLNGEYDLLIRGWYTSFFSQAPSGFPGFRFANLTNTQTRGFGLRGALDIIKKNDEISFLISPYIRYWSIEESNAVSFMGLFDQQAPANTTMEVGVKLGAEF